MTQLGQRLLADAVVRGGVQVEILLPVAPQVSGERPTGRPFSVEGGGQRLLVVEDDPALSQLLVHNLKDLGYQVVAVREAEQATAFLDLHPEVDLVLCDVVLPGRHSGPDVSRHISRTGHGAGILLMSTYTEAEMGGKGLLQKGGQLLHKPFDRRQLKERVAAVLSRTQPADSRSVG